MPVLGKLKVRTLELLLQGTTDEALAMGKPLVDRTVCICSVISWLTIELATA